MSWRKTIQDDSGWRSTIKAEAPEVSEIESGLRGAAQGATLGYSDELTGLIESLLTEKSYEQARDESRKNNRMAEEANPVSYGVGQVGAGLATAVVPGLNVQKVASLGGRAALAQGLGAVGGAGLSEESDAQGLAKDAAIGAALGGALQYGGDKLQPAVSKGIDKLKALGGKAVEKLDDVVLPQLGRITASIDPEDTAYYLRNAPKVNAETGTIETTKSEVDDFIQSILKNKANADGGVSQAKDVLRSAEQAARDSLSDERYMAGLVRNQAKETFDDQARRSVEQLQKKTLAPLHDKILQGMEELKAKVGFASGEAFDILDKAQKKNPSASVPLQSVLGEIDNGISGLTVGGTTVSDSATQSARALNQLKERLAQIPNGKISLVDAKRIIQQIDADQVFVAEKGSFAPEADAVKARVRHLLDSQLKNAVPAYREKMQQVAAHTELLSDMSRSYGTESSVIGKLQTLSTEKGRLVELPKLKRFQDATGIKFQNEIDDVLNARQILDSDVGLQNFKSKLPGAEELRNATDHQTMLQNPQVKRDLMSEVASSAEAKQLEAAQKLAAEAEAEAANLRGWSSSNTESRLKALQQNRNNIENVKVAEYIKSKTGKDISETMRNQAVRDGFAKSDTQGSRKTLTGLIVGKAIGSSVGAAAGYAQGDDVGAQSGAVLGFMGDKYAGQMLKAVLDGRLAQPQAISSLQKSYGKFAAPLVEAAMKGNKSLAAQHFILSQKFPAYQQIQEQNRKNNE